MQKDLSPRYGYICLIYRDKAKQNRRNVERCAVNVRTKTGAQLITENTDDHARDDVRAVWRLRVSCSVLATKRVPVTIVRLDRYAVVTTVRPHCSRLIDCYSILHSTTPFLQSLLPPPSRLCFHCFHPHLFVGRITQGQGH